MNIINKLNNAPFGNKSLNKQKSKSFAKQKNNSIKNDKKKTNNYINISHINTSSSYLNNTNNFSRKNKRKLLTNYVNRNINMLSVLNNNNKINNLITTNNNTKNSTNNSKVKKVKKKPDIDNNNNNNNKSNSYNINKINNTHLPETESDINDTNIQTSSEESNTLSEEDKNILSQIESLIFQLLNNGSSPKKLIFREIENIYKNSYLLFNNNNSISVGNENHKISKKNSNSNLNLSKKNIKDDSKKTLNINNKDKNKIIIENELDILNRKYNQIKEENINLKYLITEKTTAFEDVKNSLKNFQNEIDQLKNNGQNNLKNKNNDKSIDNNNDIIFVNSKGLEMKNIKLNISNVQKVNEIQDLSSSKNKQKDSNNNSINCNNLSFGQNNSFEIHFENSNSNSKNNNLNSNNNSIDPLSLTFHDQMSNVEEIQQNDLGQDLNKNYECSPSLRKATEILIQTGIMPNKDEKK